MATEKFNNKNEQVNPPKTAMEVYDMLPEMKIELMHGKIIWGGQPIHPDTEFQKEIADVVNRFMQQPSADIILFAAYITECINAYNKTVYDNE